MSTNNNKGLGIATTKAAAVTLTVNSSVNKEETAMKTVAQNNNNVNEEIKAVFDEFINQYNDEGLIRDMKKGFGNISLQKITLIPIRKGKSITLAAKVSIAAAQETLMNHRYVEDNCRLQSVTGKMVTKARGTNSISVLDVGRVASGEGLIERAVERVQEGFFLVRIDNELHVLVDISPEEEPLTKFKDITLGHQKKELKDRIYGQDVLYNKAGILKKGVYSFMAGKTLCAGYGFFTPSQNRKNMISCYKNTTAADRKMFIEALNDATLDEHSINAKIIGSGEQSVITSLCARESSKATAFGMTKLHGCAVKTVAVLFEKDSQADGYYAILSNCVARNLLVMKGKKVTKEKAAALAAMIEGYLIQSRPYTIKAAGLVYNSAAMQLELRDRNMLRVDVDDPDNKKISKDIEKVLSATWRKRHGMPKSLKDYNGVIICHGDIEAEPDIIGDFNAVKDTWNVSKIDGLNVVAIGHASLDDFRTAKTNAQGLKVVRRATMNDADASAAYKESMMGIIRTSVDESASMEIKPRTLGAEMIDTSFVPDVARILNPSNIGAYPSVFRGMVDDVNSRIKMSIILDSYRVHGHNAMLSVDPSYRFFKKSLLNVIVEEHNGKKVIIVEAYDPFFERYAKENGIDARNGIMLKNPAMGTLECLVLSFVSKQELTERAHNELKNVPAEDVDTLLHVYDVLKEGAMILPAFLEIIGMIAAGLDYDGDKGIVYFCAKDGFDTVTPVMMAIKAGAFAPRPVFIHGKGEDIGISMEIAVDAAMWQNSLANVLTIGNKSVGIITNSFRIIDEGILADDRYNVAKEYFTNLFVEVFGMGSLGNGEYEDQIEHVTIGKLAETGEIEVEISDEMKDIVVYKTESDTLKKVEEAIKKSAPTWDNIRKAIDELDVCGRHCQELTIDAAKKLAKVACEFVDRMRHFSILPFKCAPIFNMNWAEINDSKSSVTMVVSAGYSMDDDHKVKAHSFESPNLDGSMTYVLADHFAPFRAYAAEYAYGVLNNLRNQFICIANDPEMRSKIKRAYSRMMESYDAKIINNMAHVLSTVSTAESIYRDIVNAMSEEAKTCGRAVTLEDWAELNRSIASEAKTEFNDMQDYISNELRIIAQEHGVRTIDLITFISEYRNTLKSNNDGDTKKTSDVLTSLAGKVLKPETCYYLARKSEIKEIRKEITGKAAEELRALIAIEKAFNENAKVEIKDNKIVETSGYRVNLADGVYTIEDSGDKVELVRPLTDLIELPEADKTRRMFQLSTNNISADAIEAMEMGTEVSLRKIKYNGKDMVGVFCGDTLVAECFCGMFVKGVAKKDQPFNMNCDMYDGMVGKLHDYKVTSKNSKGNCFRFVCLEDVHFETDAFDTVNAATDNSEIVMPTINPDELESAESILSGF